MLLVYLQENEKSIWMFHQYSESIILALGSLFNFYTYWNHDNIKTYDKPYAWKCIYSLISEDIGSENHFKKEMIITLLIQYELKQIPI